ncbi:hypothetical protein FYK55_24455 [Roseiconus nitratireducens]|uniref:Ribosomal protein L7/L12 C-terminal domain-containing protein n=1 Tax=Roseiconus nitratireducens TaxID=2605748 RepID=A0A5M6CW85_9BACT|nr:hypothetical protein [Roseiconus nitratireducens]KAA5539487.1 hypothetical protein FYK55_24455 [Roseiconus nitratireducens]
MKRMTGEAPPYQYKVLHMSPTGTTLFPWAKQWMKDRFGRNALERQINGLQQYGWEVVSMAGGSAGFLFVVPKVTVLLRRPNDYPWDENSLDEVKRLLIAGEKIPAVMLYRDITGVGVTEAKERVARLESDR